MTPGPDALDSRPYALGYSEREFRRLTLQGAFFRDLTHDLLRRAGIAPGMRVLDLGCGVGDVALLAAELLGRSGAVLGIDRSAEAIELARWRAAQAGFTGVRFAAGEVDAFAPEETFDAVIGRLVLLYLPDPAATLRRLAGHLRAGGIVAFHEFSMPLMRSVPEGALFRRCAKWMLDTFAAAGFEIDMGSKLYATFLAAGLPAPQMILGGRVEGGAQSPAFELMANTLRSLLPIGERLGVMTARDVEVDTLADRLRQEAVAATACLTPPPLVGAWTRLSGLEPG